MQKLKLVFKKDCLHYQTFNNSVNVWIDPVHAEFLANGWVRVTYQDNIVVHYPREAFDMIIGAK